MVHEWNERVLNLSKYRMIGPQVDFNFSGWRRSEYLIFSSLKNTRSFNHREELGGRSDFQSNRILFRAKRVEEAIMFLCFYSSFTFEVHSKLLLFC